MIKSLKNKIVNNLGAINLFGKSFGRVLLLILTAYLSTKLSTDDFAVFAIFYTSLKMFTFYAANNLYIIYFNEVRESLLNEKKWPKSVSSNILITLSVFIIIITFLSYLILNSHIYVLLLVLSLICNVIIRNLAEFSKSDNNIFLSILIEDILFLFLFFVFSLIGLYLLNDVISVFIALFVSLIISLIVCLILFKNKFRISINTFEISIKDFSFTSFKLGINYTFLRSNEVLCSFATRYLGQIYFGSTFVAYAHIVYQFYNVFNLLTMSVISGYQSRITIPNKTFFSKKFVIATYINLGKTIFPLVLFVFSLLVIFSESILLIVFPKYFQYSALLIKVSFAGLIFAIVQPLVFILIYNNRFSNIKLLNYIQYSLMALIFSMPYFFKGVNEQYWLLIIMTILVVTQGVFAWFNFKNVK